MSWPEELMNPLCVALIAHSYRLVAEGFPIDRAAGSGKIGTEGSIAACFPCPA